MFVPTLSNAIYYEIIGNIKGKATIAEPIVKVENMQNTVQQTIDKTSEINTYKFCVKNYILENDQITKRISEVDMEYDIQIQNEKENFPIKYELYEEGENVNLLNENGKTEKINFKARQEYEKVYTLVVTWDKKSGELSDSNHINIIVNSSQIK